MSDKKRPNTDELYTSSQWSDNMSFSREAMTESQKKNAPRLPVPAESAEPSQAKALPPPLPTTRTKSPPPPARASAPLVAPGSTTPAKSAPPRKHTTDHLDLYVSEMNQEISRVSDAVGNQLDSLGERVMGAFARLFEPIFHSVTGLAEALLQMLHTITIGLMKAVIQEFTFALRTLTGRAVRQPQAAEPLVSAVPEPDPQPAVSQKITASLNQDHQVPAFRTNFGTLVQLKVFFSTIHNRPFLSEQDLRDFHPGNKRLEYEWMTRAIEEIRNCAPYGQKLPVPPKGPFMGIPMHDVLREVTYSDLENFLSFVSHRPQPFQQKPLKLSEAYATWAHKGAPDH